MAKTLDELVEFWDEHDFADYWDDLEEVDAREAAPGYRRTACELPLEELIEAVDHLPVEDARRLYRRLAERLS